MAEYTIPNIYFNDLENKINKISRKGAHIVFNVINDNYLYETVRNHTRYVIPCKIVEVEGSYKINGWDFVAVIQHAEPENIIRIADRDFDNRIPERYRHAGRNCEHCNITRDRNDTYLVYNEETQEFKQVGKTCLKNYTDGLDAETCAAFASVMTLLDKIESAQNEAYASDELENIFGEQVPLNFYMEDIRKKAFKFISDHGYEANGSSARAFNSALETGIADASDDDIAGMTEWLQNNPSNSDWLRNVRAVWNKAIYESRDLNLLLSGIGVYLREKQRKESRDALLNNEANTWAGEVGDKVEITVDSAMIIGSRGGYSYGYIHFSSYPVYKIIDTSGKVYIWGDSTCSGIDKNNNCIIVRGTRLKGTIKAQITSRNGERQTELTRCKFTLPSANLDDNGNEYRGFFR